MRSFFSKVLLLLVLSGLVAVYDGCKKSDLDLKPHTPTEADYFTTESEFTAAVIGIYAKMDDYFAYNGGTAYGGAASEFNMLLLPGDDITSTDNNPFEIFGTISSTNGILNAFYSTAYQIISRSNVVLEKIAEVGPSVYTTPGLSDYHKGEALFLRGYAFYFLWNYYGTSPLDTVRVTSESQFYPGNSTGTQLLDQAISDFSAAASLLPASWDAQDRGRVVKNSAYGMLGKSLVFRASWTKNTADYTSALAAFGNISGASLVAKFDDNFAFDTENNSESLFEFQATQAQQTNNVWLSNDFNYDVGDASCYYGFYLGPGQDQYAQGKFVGTAKLAGIFDAGDPRKALTLDATNSIQKYVSRNKFDQNGVGSVNNYRLFRYADVLLLQAEATLESGGSTSAAIGYINQVRQRARNMVSGGISPADLDATVTDNGTIMQWIMDERLRELAGEGQRWFDVRRWAQQGVITLNNAYFSSIVPSFLNYQSYNLLFPIPNSETDVNTNIKQNPGYN